MNKRQQVYHEVKRQILFLELKPGQRLIENDIIEKMQIGRTPVREALLMLENEKLLQCEKKSGYFVKRLSLQEVYDYIEIRRLLEAHAVSLIIKRISPSEIQRLCQNIKDTEEALMNQEEKKIVQCESEFHTMLYAATKSDVFIDAISTLSDKFQWLRAIAFRNSENARRSIAQHSEILAAIEAHNEAGAQKLVVNHIELLEDSLSIARDFFLLDS